MPILIGRRTLSDVNFSLVSIAWILSCKLCSVARVGVYGGWVLVTMVRSWSMELLISRNSFHDTTCFFFLLSFGFEVEWWDPLDLSSSRNIEKLSLFFFYSTLTSSPWKWNPRIDSSLSCTSYLSSLESPTLVGIGMGLLACLISSHLSSSSHRLLHLFYPLIGLFRSSAFFALLRKFA